ncbi:hypothetical protein NONI108955_37950 [Nocardia ninae]|uniref:Uncharacterized protein n=1 Tax=Nocardia ninae NBRC 108245 TaxID=1210091 RepID=A0A511MIQ2_9NOCA|nr:hypothetical protein [Nocardia ninae]GEM39967.1 hypothetical protein NN4_44860 [Nocardia ninae NBRC 108245]
MSEYVSEVGQLAEASASTSVVTDGDELSPAEPGPARAKRAGRAGLHTELTDPAVGMVPVRCSGDAQSDPWRKYRRGLAR